MSGLDPIRKVITRQLRYVVIRPANTTLDPTLETTEHRGTGGFFALVNDDPDTERDGSQGPAAFNSQVLQAYATGSHVIVASAVIEDRHSNLLAALVALSPTPFFVLVATQPQHHADWTRKIAELTGQPPIIHIATEGTGPTEWGTENAVPIP